MAVMEKSVILTDKQIKQKTKRIAYEIFENNFSEKELLLAGIKDQGYVFANFIKNHLESIAPFAVRLIAISLDKETPTQSAITLDCEESELRNKSIVLIDDVSNSGRTLAYSMKPFLNVKVKKLETAVLVNRSHTRFPIAIRYSGYELATTINEHVEVQLSTEACAAYLY